MTKLEGYQSKPEEVYASAINMTIMAFINSGLTIQLVYFRWIPGYDLPLLLNKYSTFSQEWYQEIGSIIVITVCLMVFIPHLSNIAQQLLYGCLRCCDRGCSCDDRKTRKLVQEDYENINTGNEFMLEFRYSNMLTIISVSFLYSGGMPFLYPVVAAFFFCTYWVDKCLLFRYYRKPIQFDNYLAKRTLSYYKYILVLHIFGFLLMYGKTPILHNDLFEHLDFDSISFQDKNGKFSFYSVYFWLIVFIVTAFLLWALPIKNCWKIINHCCCRRLFNEIKDSTAYRFEEDFYQCINFTALKEKLIQVQDTLEKARTLK